MKGWKVANSDADQFGRPLETTARHARPSGSFILADAWSVIRARREQQAEPTPSDVMPLLAPTLFIELRLREPEGTAFPGDFE